MNTSAEIELPAEEVALAETFAAVPDLTVHLERVVAHGSSTIAPLVWVTGAEVERVERALDTDPSVTAAQRLTDCDDPWLYQMNWEQSAQVVEFLLEQTEGTICEARGANGTWIFQVLFPERTGLSNTYRFCTDNGFAISINTIHELASSTGRYVTLTDAQRTALAAALDQGYFDIPRETTLEELAAELDISHQALSERLQRATKALAENALSSE